MRTHEKDVTTEDKFDRDGIVQVHFETNIVFRKLRLINDVNGGGLIIKSSEGIACLLSAIKGILYSPSERDVFALLKIFFMSC